MPNAAPNRRALLVMGLGACWPACASPSGYEWRPWPAGRAAPPLELPSLDGAPWRLGAQRGRVVLVNFWASWCGPCRAELPSLVQLAARHADDGIAFVTVNYRESAATISRFLDAQHLALPVLLDADGRAARAWTPMVFPSTVVLRRDGRPAGVLVGEIDWLGSAAGQILAPLLGRG